MLENINVVQAMMARVEQNPNDILFADIEKNASIICALQQRQNWDASPAFKKLHAIAQITLYGEVAITGEDALQGLLWFLDHEKERKRIPLCIRVRGLADENCFARLVQHPSTSTRVRFENLKVSLAAILNFLRPSQSYFIEYLAQTDSCNISLNDENCSTFVLQGFGDSFKWPELTQVITAQKFPFQLVFSSHVFTLQDLENLLQMSKPLVLRGVRFAPTCHISADVRTDFFMSRADAIKSGEIVLPSFLDEEYQTFLKESAVYPQHLQSVRIMITRLDDNPNDLQLTDFSKEVRDVILRLAHKKDVEFCHSSSFKKIHAIAAILTNRNIVISDEESLQGVLWYLEQKELAPFMVLNLPNENYFLQLIQNRNSHFLRFIDLGLSTTALIKYVTSRKAGSYYKIKYSAQKDSFRITDGFFRTLEVEGFSDSFTCKDLEAQVNAVREEIQIIFAAPTFFTLEDIRDVLQFSPEKIRDVRFESSCQFSVEAKAHLFQLLEAGKDIRYEVMLGETLQQEYQEYRESRVQLNFVKDLIEKYKNNTLSYAELRSSKTEEIVQRFCASKQQDPAIDAEILADLLEIVNFPLYGSDEVIITTDRMFKAVKWLMMRSGVDFDVGARNAEEAKLLLKAYEQNENNRGAFATIHLGVSLASSIIFKSVGIHAKQVTVTVKGTLENPSVFNDVINTISQRGIMIDLANSQLIRELDLSHPMIRKISLKNEKITAEHVALLSQAQNLRAFTACDCQFDSPETKARFVDTLLNNPNLRSLLLIRCNLTGIHVAKIQAYAEAHPNFREMDLSGNLFRDTDDEKLKEALRRNKELCVSQEQVLEQIRVVVRDGLKLGESVKSIQKILGAHSFVHDADFVVEFVEIMKNAVQKVIQSSVFAPAVKSKLCDQALIMLIENGYTSEGLFKLQQSQFDFEREKATKIQSLGLKLDSIDRLQALVCLNSPQKLFEELYAVFFDLADFACSGRGVTRQDGIKVFNYLISIPPHSESYALVEEKIKRVLLMGIKGILNFDIAAEGTKPFQRDSLRDLEEKINSGEMTLPEILAWIRAFTKEASMTPIRLPFSKETYITNKRTKVGYLEELHGLLQSYLASLSPAPSAPPKEKGDIQEYTKAVEDKQKQHQKENTEASATTVSSSFSQMYPALEALPNNISGVSAAPPVFIPDAQNMPQYQSPVTPSAPPLSNEKPEVNVEAAPVPYSQPLSDAQLAVSQRTTESQSVLQGVVAPTPDSAELIWPEAPTHAVGTVEGSVEESLPPALQQNNAPRKTAQLDG